MRTTLIAAASTALIVSLNSQAAISGTVQLAAAADSCTTVLALATTAEPQGSSITDTATNARQANRNRFRYNFNEPVRADTAPAATTVTASGCTQPVKVQASSLN